MASRGLQSASFYTSEVFNVALEHEQLALIHIRIRPSPQPDEFTAEIHAGEYFDQWTIRMSDRDLEDMNQEFQNIIESSIVNVEDWKRISKKELESLVRPLAQQGHDSYLWIFSEKRVRSRMESMLGQRKGARSAITIQIASEKLFLPWELIYPPSAKRNIPVYLKKFWGFNFIIHRIIPPWYRPPTIMKVKSKARVRLGLLTDISLPSVKDKEIPFFKRLSEKGHITLVKLRKLDPERFAEDFTKFEVFWEKNFNIAHFACHATYEGTPAKTKFILTSDFPVSLRDMNELRIKGNPLIIINACESGVLNPLYTKNFASYFIEREAMGVVATECPIPDRFAAAFAERLYTLLIRKKRRLGESLLLIRNYFFEKDGDPTGLLYSLYAPPSIRVNITGDRNETKTKRRR